MFARRLRVFLKIGDKKTFLRSSRDYVEPNLKFSTIPPSKPLQFPSGRTLKRSIFSTEKIEGYSNLSQTSDQPENADDEDPSEHHPIHGSYRNTENRLAYSVLRNNPRYKKTIVPPIIPDEKFPEETIENILRKQWAATSDVSEVIENFRILSYDARSNNKKFTDEHIAILEKLTSIVKELLTDQMWLLLRYVEMWYPMPLKTKLRALTTLEDALDEECWKRSLEWDANDLLMTCDLFYHLRRLGQSKFTGYAMKKLGSKPSKMSSDNYPHYMYLLNAGRKPHINMYELEYRLEAIVEEFNPEELAIIAMGFFKTATLIRNPALSGHIIQKCIDNMATLDEIYISAIMKMARLSVHLRDREILRGLLRRFKIRINTISTACLVHTAHTGSATLVYEKEVMDLIMNELVKRGLSDARLKDIERILFSLMIFNYPKDFPLYEMAVEELRNPVRTTERKKFAITYACSLMYLSLADIYPLDIINSIMNPEYLKEVYRNNAFKIGREYLTLECGLKLEVPEYEGPFLPERIYNYLAKRYASGVVWRDDPLTQTQTYHKFLFEVVHYLKAIVGENNYFIDQVLPQYQRGDIILCMDSQNNFISPEEMLLKCPQFRLKFTPERTKNYKWFAVVLASHNHMFRESTLLSGTSNAKLRHLTRAGYTPITIMLSTWTKFKEAERQEFLRDVLTEHINNKEHTSS
ncbi:uncharacterized protein LOC107045330 [Diachasma alloeum]|uniref:uncharacterized protein LOC107045330 n=1 Tax=Diachasma alloeum TaxID=454923 RepID=UPI0007385036|nr:uncharacterized protein LOC107045330 [Diachasma alloeum]